MKKVVMWAAVAVSIGVVATASADITRYRLTFTAADMFNTVYDDGEVGDKAAENGVYDGARLLRVGQNPDHADAGRTYIESQQDKFDTRWDQYANTGWTFDTFNLWGFDGRGANWGEDFKAAKWRQLTGPAGWNGVRYTWPWGDPPAGSYTDKFPLWYADDGAGVPLNSAYLDLADLEFTVDLYVEDGDEFWGQDVHGAPNNLDGPNRQLTMWFGGFIYSPDGTQSHLYEGNMVLDGDQIQTIIPVPGAALLGVLGLGIVARIKRSFA